MSLRVVAAGTWDEGPGYPRARALLAGLRARGVDVIEVRVPLAGARGSARRALAGAPWRWPSFLWSNRRARRRLRQEFERAALPIAPDAVLVPYPGHLAVRWVRSWFRGPIVLDLFLTAHGTAVEDRGLFGPGSVPARLLAAVDRRACRAADLVLMDTPQHAEHVRSRTGLPPERFGWVPVSDAEHPATAVPLPERAGLMRLLFFGTGVPLHGLEVLVRAVAQSRGVHLTLVGGCERDRALATELLADRLDLRAAFVQQEELRECLRRSELVAGVFGTSPKAALVVPFKVMHALACGRGVITSDSPAVRELLRPGQDCVTCRPGDVDDLAARLDALAAQPVRLRAMALEARRTFDRSFSLDATGERLARLIAGLCGVAAGSPEGPAPVPELAAR